MPVIIVFITGIEFFRKLGLGLESVWTHETNVQAKIEGLLQQYYKREELKATQPVKTSDAEHPWL